MKKLSTALAVSAIVLSGCAQSSKEISAAYVSPVKYQSFSCRQLSEEARRISVRASQAIGAQDKKASNDTAAMSVGMILFWPALFFIKGDSETAAEVARLKGEMDAIEAASVQKNCGIVFQHATKEEIEKKKAAQAAE
ncbi:hypothetical protein E0K89_011090 [Aquicoccus sp. SCR17]|nr:hypothetical protein [Carideicomes alvinocaridis]